MLTAVYFPSLLLVPGGVLLAKRPTLVAGTRSALAYGVKKCKPWADGMKEEYKVHNKEENKWYCRHVFDTLIRAQELVPTDHVVNQTWVPWDVAATAITFNVYTSPSNEVQYTTDPGVVHLGTVKLHLPEGWSEGLQSANDRKVKVTFTAGQAELQVTAEDVKSGKRVQASMDFIAF